MSAAEPVSVVVTTYNQARYIEEALRSVLAQSVPPAQIIVVDDGSTDDTPTRLAAFGNRIEYVRQTNLGIAGARNTGIALASCDYLAFLDGDDVWEPEKLAVQLSAAQRHPEAGLIAVDGVLFSEDDGVLTGTLLGQPIRDLLVSSGEPIVTAACHRRLLQGNFICTTSQVMVPRHVFNVVGLSDGTLELASDYDLYLRIAATYPFTFVKQRLTRWRYHEKSASGPETIRDLRWNAYTIAVWKKHLRLAKNGDRCLLRQQIRATVTRSARVAYYYGHTTNRKWAAHYLLKLFSRNPSFVSISLFFIGLWCPDFLSRIAHLRLKRILEYRKNHT